jgi:hypothetical protein
MLQSNKNVLFIFCRLTPINNHCVDKTFAEKGITTICNYNNKITDLISFSDGL